MHVFKKSKCFMHFLKHIKYAFQCLLSARQTVVSSFSKVQTLIRSLMFIYFECCLIDSLNGNFCQVQYTSSCINIHSFISTQLAFEICILFSISFLSAHGIKSIHVHDGEKLNHLSANRQGRNRDCMRNGRETTRKKTLWGN